MRLLISAVCALTFCLLTTGAWADSVTIVNPSFESTFNLGSTGCGTGCAYNFDAPPGWTIPLGVQNPSLGSFEPCGLQPCGTPASNSLYFNSKLPDGFIVAFINNGAIAQTLGVSVLPDATYTLSVEVGRRNDITGVNYSLNLLDGSNILGSCTQSGSNASIQAGTFADITLTCTTGSSVPAGLLGIELTGSGTQVDFDNVQLNVTSAVSTPEPGALALTFVALFMGGLLFLRSRRNQYLESASS